MDNVFQINKENFRLFMDGLIKEAKVYSPLSGQGKSKEKNYYYQAIDCADRFEFNPYRAAEPLKLFFTHPFEKTGDYFGKPAPAVDLERLIIFGVKSCDIAAHKIQDFVFLQGVEVDSLYRSRRENTILISSDCTDFKKNCFCLAMDVLPYPKAGFDLNLTPLHDGYLVGVGSQNGQKLIDLYKKYFTPARETEVLARKNKRDIFVEKIRQHIAAQGMPDIGKLQQLVQKGYSLDTWQNFMLTCVECGGCNLICDTCHCFLLSDQRAKDTNSRIRQWDSCQYANFSRVAGGGNPLKTRAARLRNRFTKKFDFFPDNLGIPGCCGCGRCIEVCPGKIDIREVLKDLAKKVTQRS